MTNQEVSRFFKSDLQMQTPVDRFHWRGLPLPPSAGPQQRTRAAHDYVRRCYEVGLEVIAITEHNIAPLDCDSLIPELEAAARSLRADYNHDLHIFPGFEVAAPMGKGTHILCLFEPGTPVWVLDEKLAALGLPKTKRFNGRQAEPLPSADLTRDRILNIIQEDTSYPGLIVLAHATGNSGVLDPKTVDQWWSADVLKDERFLCLELPHSRDHYLNLAEQPLIKSVLQNIDPRYKRRHPIASICSSDCKTLDDTTGEPNFIGYRHTWIKMASPSIEGLRQAFLDHESRIRFGDSRPEEVQTHPRINTFSFGNVRFLRDQKVAFSPNLNVIIGGSGSGKSTIVHYLRMCLAQDSNIQGKDVRDNFEKSLATVELDSDFHAQIQIEDETIDLAGKGPGSLEQDSFGAELGSLAKVFPVRFFGQREIYNIAEDREATRRLLDDLVEEDLDLIARKERGIVDEIKRLQVNIDRQSQLEQDRDDLQAEIRSTEAKIGRLRETAAPLAALSDASRIAGRLRRLQDQSRAPLAHIRNLQEELARERSRLDISRHSPASAMTAVLEEVDRLSLTIRTAADAYDEAVKSIWTNNQDVVEILENETRAVSETEEIRHSLAQQGVDPNNLSTYESSMEAKRAELESLNQRILSCAEDARLRERLLSDLKALWAEQVRLREESAAQLNDSVPATTKGTPFVHVQVEPYGDGNSFREIVGRYRGDRRRLSDDDWDGVMEAALHSTTPGNSPLETLLQWVDELARGATPRGFPWTQSERRSQRFLDCMSKAATAELGLARVADRVVITLSRQDGSVAGELEGGLSVGQKCTAILAILLARDTAPVVIDQPEDEIDNEFTFREMVPLLRRVRDRRQLIIVTHDPNIPVNADAEMILALEAVGGHGTVKMVNGRRAVGGLDQTHVRLAVEEIMEGSEEAFRRRFAKYGF